MPSLAPRRNAGQQLITPYICVLPSTNCTCTYMHIQHTHTENDRTGSKATWGSLYIFPLPSIFCSVCADYISSSQPNGTMLKRTGHPQQGHAVTVPWTPVQSPGKHRLLPFMPSPSSIMDAINGTLGPWPLRTIQTPLPPCTSSLLNWD